MNARARRVVPGDVSVRMSTATSLSVRALLNSAIAQTGVVRSRALCRPDGAGQGARRGGRGPLARATPSCCTSSRPTPDLETAVADVRFFLGALEALSDAAADASGRCRFPSHQVDPYRGMAPHFRVTSARARALHAAALGTARVIVASAQALLPRLAAPESILATSFDLRPGVEDRSARAGRHPGRRRLRAAGSRRRARRVLGARRHPRRLSRRRSRAGPHRVHRRYVESIRRFDPGTQRSIETLDQFQIVPVREPEDADERSSWPAAHGLRLPARVASRCASSCPSPKMCARRSRNGPSRSARRSRSASPTRRRLAGSGGRRPS